MEAEKSYFFRPYTSDDVSFIHSSWGKSYFSGACYNLSYSPQELEEFHRPLRDKFFASPTATVIICASKEEPTLIIGWIAVENANIFTLHYVYVKSVFKDEGIALDMIKAVVPEGPVIYTHLTEKAHKILLRRKDQFRNFYPAPYLLFTHCMRRKE